VRIHRRLPLELAAAAMLAGALVLVSAPVSSASGCAAGLPGGQLAGVAATSSSSAWAVGRYAESAAGQTLIDHWNGTAWCQLASPDPGGSGRDNALSSVAATSSSNAWSVGYYVNRNQVEQTLVLHWNGSSWKKVASPDPGGNSRWNALSGVSATSSSNAWAVGYHVNRSHVEQTLVLHWNGTAWRTVPSPDIGTNNELIAVKAISKSNAWAVGYHDTKAYVAQTMIAHWNGTSWKTVASPDPAGSSYANSLSAVTAVSASNAWAVGSYYNAAAAEPLILHWNGTAWKQVASPDPGGSASDNVLYGVTATSSSYAWTAGAYRNTASVYQTLVARWNGTAWQQAASPNTAASQHNILNSVAATSASNAWAVGFTASASTGTGYQTLILHWNGTGWTYMTSP
jgi:hypothetical protein